MKLDMASKCAVPPQTTAAAAGGGAVVVVKREPPSPPPMLSVCCCARSSHDAAAAAARRRSSIDVGGIALPPPLASSPSVGKWSLPRGRAFGGELAFIRLRAHSSTEPVHRRDMVDLEESEPQVREAQQRAAGLTRHHISFHFYHPRFLPLSTCLSFSLPSSIPPPTHTTPPHKTLRHIVARVS